MGKRGGPRVSFGPSWIALLTEVDTASIVTGLQVGAAQGCLMALAALALTVPLFFVHEVAGSMGPASGMGMGGAVRKLFGVRAAGWRLTAVNTVLQFLLATALTYSTYFIAGWFA